ncbi:MAG TPA: cytochrome P450 [Acidimicrobiales bacterium]|jgi:cytochrome P450|nr:cytochrome P450 [Acidimicrobiales bacterium]
MATDLIAAEADAVVLELVATPEGRADPYSRYARLRSMAPVHRSAIGFWVLTRFDDCQAVSRDARVGKDFSGAARALGLSDAQQAEQAAFRDDHSNMLFADPPDHTRLRGLATRAFTPRTVEALRGRVVAIVDQLIDSFGAGEVDLMDTLAFPLPVTVIGEMLGVPAEDRAQFRPLVRASTAVLELAVTPEALAAATAARATMEEYFAALVAERRAHPRDDLLTQLIEAEDKGDQLSERELISTAILLFAAGFETTTHLIGNSVLALLGDPVQLGRLRNDRSLLRPGVEELLRYDSPVQITARTANEAIDVAGHDIEAGDTLLVLLGAANRDPDRFTDPDRLDVGRDGGAALSFGSGIHYCLGAALARLEGQVVLDRLLERFATWELVGGQPGHRDSLTLRGLVDLRVRFTP